MGVVDVTLQPWLGFDTKIGTEYFFRVKICVYIEVANYPLIQLGATQIPLTPDILLSIAEVLQACPTTIASGTKIPYYTLGGEWTCPENIKLDRAKAPVLVSPGNYVGATTIPWTIANFWESTLVYIPEGDPLTAYPGSDPNYDEGYDGSGGIYLMPNVSNFYLETDYRCAFKQITFNYTAATYWGAFIYSGNDLDTDHIWETYNYVHNDPIDPYVQYYPGIKATDGYHATIQGYTVYPKNFTGVAAICTERWRHTDPFEFEWYPDRDLYPPTIKGGFPPFVVGLGMLAQFLPSLNVLLSSVKEEE